MDKLVTLLDLCPSNSSHSTNLRLLCQVAFLSLKGAAMDSCMNRYANLCKLKVEMSMHHAYDKSWKTMGDISTDNPYEKWLFHWEYTQFSDKPKLENLSLDCPNSKFREPCLNFRSTCCDMTLSILGSVIAKRIDDSLGKVRRDWGALKVEVRFMMSTTTLLLLC